MKKQEEMHPITVEDHKGLEKIHAEKKITAVNDALKFPTGDAFEEEVNSILNSDAEANGEVVAIALTDCAAFLYDNGVVSYAFSAPEAYAAEFVREGGNVTKILHKP